MRDIRQTLRTLTGCNEETADYIQTATGGYLQRLSNIETSRLTEAQQRKVKALSNAIYMTLQGYDDAPIKISRSSDVYDLLAPEIAHIDHEEVWCVFMRQDGSVITHQKVGQGGFTGSLVDPKVVFIKALEARCTRMVLVHNHPSGSKAPSQTDIRLTEKIKNGANLFDIQLTDHVIIAKDSYYSFLDEGRM